MAILAIPAAQPIQRGETGWAGRTSDFWGYHWLAMEHHGGVLAVAATQEYPTTRDP